MTATDPRSSEPESSRSSQPTKPPGTSRTIAQNAGSTPDEYADDLQTFSQALSDFEAVLESEGVNLRALLDASAELAVAGEVLAEEVNCPTV